MKECPYRVYYFPANDIPYQMNYRPDGKFSNKFGSGFFDEASKWDMTIIRKEFELKKKAKK